MPIFSDDLRKYQELEERYKVELADYESESRAYQILLERDPKEPALAGHYTKVSEKNRKVQQTYAELEQMRRSLSSAPRA